MRGLMRGIGLLWPWLLLSLPLAASAVELRSYRVERYTATQGLTPESLLRAVPLADGRLLLIGTRGEPLLFDGHRFAPPAYPRADAAAFDGGFSALETRNGDLWISSMRRGLIRIRDDAVFRMPLPDGMRPTEIRLGQDGQRLLVASQLGLHTLQLDVEPPRFDSVASGQTLLTVIESNDGRIFAAGVNGVFVPHDGELVPVHARLEGVHVWSLEIDSDGRLLVGTRGLGLIIIDRAGELTTVGLAEGLPNSVIRGIAVTDDSVWLATAGGGLARLRDAKVEVLDSTHGLSSDTVTGVAADRKGVVWATTAGAGLNRLSPGPLTTFSDARGRRGGFHYALHRDPAGAIWVGSNQGLALLRDGVLMAVGAPGPGQAGTVVSIVDAPDGGLLLGTRVGVYRYRDDRFEPLAATAAWMRPLLLRDASATVYATSGDQLFTLDAAGNSTLLARLPDTGAVTDTEGVHVINAIAEDSQFGLLLGSNRGAWTWRAGRLQALADTPVNGFWREGEHLWLSGAPLRLLGPDASLALTLEADGTLAGPLYNIWPDRHGGVWMTSADGLWRVERASLRGARLGESLMATRLGLTDGLPSTEFEGGPQQVLPLAGGNLLLASTGGVSRLEPAALGASSPSLTLRLHAVEAGEIAYPPSPQLQLPPGTRRVALSFSALPASHSAAARVSYRLLPIESSFRSDRGRREAVYAALGPGDYLLELKAHLPGLQPSESRLGYAFRIAPRWIERREVQLGAGMAVMLTLLLVPALRIRALRAQRSRLEAAVAERTAALEALARTDGLTGLLNRRSFDHGLARLLASGQAFGLVLTDVDHFKRYNDSLGHQAGDACLKAVASTLHEVAETRDSRIGNATVARVGGEEFAVLVPNADAQAVAALAERLRAALEARALPHPSAPLGRVSISLGATVVRPADAADTLIQRADAALYRAKAEGRNRWVVD